MQALLFVSGAEPWCSLLAQPHRPALPMGHCSETDRSDTGHGFTTGWLCAAPPCSWPNTHLCHTQPSPSFNSWFVCPSPCPLQGVQNRGTIMALSSVAPLCYPAPSHQLIFTQCRSPLWQGRGFSTLSSSTTPIWVFLSQPYLVLPAFPRVKV